MTTPQLLALLAEAGPGTELFFEGSGNLGDEGLRGFSARISWISWVRKCTQEPGGLPQCRGGARPIHGSLLSPSR